VALEGANLAQRQTSQVSVFGKLSLSTDWLTPIINEEHPQLCFLIFTNKMSGGRRRRTNAFQP
jgi:hypothetical protein